VLEALAYEAKLELFDAADGPKDFRRSTKLQAMVESLTPTQRLAGGVILRSMSSTHDLDKLWQRLEGKVPDHIRQEQIVHELTPEQRRKRVAELKGRIEAIEAGRA
jgi:Spy/CpxP family protein refolding chaperone